MPSASGQAGREVVGAAAAIAAAILSGAGEGEVFGGKFGRQDFDHRLVLQPDFDHVERAAVVAQRCPGSSASDRLPALNSVTDDECERLLRAAVASVTPLWLFVVLGLKSRAPEPNGKAPFASCLEHLSASEVGFGNKRRPASLAF